MHAVYRLSDGALVSTGSVVAPAAALAEAGLGAVSLDLPAGRWRWDAALRKAEAVAEEVAASEPSLAELKDLMLRIASKIGA